MPTGKFLSTRLPKTAVWGQLSLAVGGFCRSQSRHERSMPTLTA